MEAYERCLQTFLKLQYQNTFDLIAYLLILRIDFCYK